MRKDGLCQAGVIGGMPTSALLLLSGCTQPVQGIVPNQLQHTKACCLGGRYLRLDEAGIDQSREREDRLFGRPLSLGEAYRLCCLQCPASHKDAQGTKTALLVFREQLITPGDGVLHRLLACWQVSRPAA